MTASRSARPTASPRSQRWAKRDALRPEARRDRSTSWTAVDDKTFTIKLKQPFALTARRARQAVVQRAVHHARAAREDRLRSSRSRTPSAPARSSSSRRNGCRATRSVYVKNADYVPRKEPPSLGRRRQGRQGRPRRVDLHPGFRHRRRRAQQPARSTGASRCRPTSCPVLAKNKDIKVENTDPLGYHGHACASTTCSRPSTTRRCAQAVLCARRPEGLHAGASPAIRRTGSSARRSSPAARRCPATVGAEPLKGKRDFAKAKQLHQGGRLQGREDRRPLGDRPADRAQPGAGHHRAAAQASASTSSCRPATGARSSPGAPPRSRSTRAAGASSTPGWWAPTWRRRRSTPRCAAAARRRWFGWPTDPKSSRSCATPGSSRRTRRRRRRSPQEIQKRGLRERAVHARPAQFIVPTAYRKNISRAADRRPIAFLWNVEKK